MTDEQKKQICLMRKNGMGYRLIAANLGVTRDQVRSYCVNHGLTGTREAYEATVRDRISEGLACCYCGGPLKQPKRGRHRRFCSEECRRLYWALHRRERKPKERSMYLTECRYCHKIFATYGDRTRKFCCHDHYVLYRFGHMKKASPENTGGAFLNAIGKEDLNEVSRT